MHWNNKKNIAIIFAGALALVFFLIIVFFQNRKPTINPSSDILPSPSQETRTGISRYPLHVDITATVFWVGEKASADNNYIPNSQSAWDENWLKNFGGSDGPLQRSDFFPAKFTPRENPFYVALPYNDFDDNGDRKPEAFARVYWAKNGDWNPAQSLLKNQWVKIIKNDTTVYAQWEDVGPFSSDDLDYVFGQNKPHSQINQEAGIDVSPAIRDFLRLNGEEKINWQFIDAVNVPDGPWKKIVTTS